MSAKIHGKFRRIPILFFHNVILYLEIIKDWEDKGEST